MQNTIVYIEDNPTDARILIQWLQAYGITNEVQVIDDGIKALNWIESLTEDPMLIVLDLGLPGIDGIELLRYLKSTLKTYDIPIMILSGSSDERDRIKGKIIDGNGYITKPLMILEFFQELARMGFCLQICRKEN